VGVLVSADNNLVQSNNISSTTGTNAAGTLGSGMLIGNGCTGTIIQSNDISINAGNGILFYGAAPGHTVGDPLPASGSGSGGATNPVGLLVARTNSPLDNSIDQNGLAGVSVQLATATNCHRESILGNSISFNGTLSIDLGGSGKLLTNQPPSNQGDSTLGPNALQNYPVLSGVSVNGNRNTVTKDTVTGTLTSAPNATYRIEFYSVQTLYLGYQYVTTNGSGVAPFSTVLPNFLTVLPNYSGGESVTATATDAVGNTSEFSPAVTGPAPTPGVATTTTLTSSSNPSVTGQIVTFTATVAAGSGSTVPTGKVAFTLNGSPLATVALSGGKATTNVTGAAPGTATIAATYIPAQGANFAGSSGNLTQIVTAPTTTNNTLSINDVNVAKPATGTTNAVFTVTLATGIISGGKRKSPIVKPGRKSGRATANGNVTVNFATMDGTAIAGTDYKATSGTLTFSPSQTTATIPVMILGGAGTGTPVKFTVKLSGATNATISRVQGTGTITSVAPATPNVVVTQSASATSVAAGTPVTFTLTAQNTGTASAPDVVVFDTLPAGATFVSSSPSATQNGQTLTFSLGALAAGASKTLSVVVTAPNATTTLVNTSTASATGPGGMQGAPSTASVAVTGSTSGAPTDVTGLVTVSRGRLITIGPYTPGLYRKGNRERQIVTIRNKSKTPITGPMYLVLDGLSSNAVLLNSNGVATGGSAFILLPLKNNVLSAGGSVRVALFFGITSRAKLSYSTRVLAGTGSP